MIHRVVFLSGPPKAGKSVVGHEIRQQLLTSSMANRFFLERLHHDQEGNWAHESHDGQVLARARKNRIKADGTFWSDRFVTWACMSVEGLARHFELVLGDMGGVPSEQNQRIVDAARATGASAEAVLLAPDGGDTKAWLRFWKAAQIRPTVVRARLANHAFGSPEFNGEVQRLASTVRCYASIGEPDTAHGPDHVTAVRKHSRRLAKKYAPSSLRLVDEAARLHDIGNAVDRSRHEHIGADVVAADPAMQTRYGPSLRTIEHAIRQHRSSTGRPGRSVVAQIVRDADRLGTPDGSSPLRRAMEYQLSSGRAKDLEAALRQAADHILAKYGAGGRGMTGIHFPETLAMVSKARVPILRAAEQNDLMTLARLAGFAND